MPPLEGIPLACSQVTRLYNKGQVLLPQSLCHRRESILDIVHEPFDNGWILQNGVESQVGPGGSQPEV